MLPVTLTDPKPIPSIPYIKTNADRDLDQIVRLEIHAMKMFRCPEGFEVGTATPEEWAAAGGLPL